MKNVFFHIFLVVLVFCVPCSVLGSDSPYLSRYGVNLSTGNHFYQQIDVSFSGSGSGFGFVRHYNSQSEESGIFGYGWRFSLSDRLLFEGTEVVYVGSDGNRTRLSASGDAWVNSLGRKLKLERREGGGYVLSSPDNRERRVFDESGRLLERRESDGRVLSLEYSGKRLVRLSDGFGHVLSLDYDESGRVSRLRSGVGDVLYAYDAQDNLVSVTDPLGGETRYLYEDPTDVHKLTGVVDATGVRVRTVSYTANGRVETVSLSEGRDAIRIEWLPGYQRKVTDAFGVVTTYELAVRNRVARLKSFSGGSCASSCREGVSGSFTHDNWLQVLTETDAQGVVTKYSYDSAGNRRTKVEAFGTPLARTTTYTYTAGNQVASVTEHSASGGNKSLVTSLSYDEQGKMIRRVRSGYAGADAVSETYSFSYNSFGQLTGVDGPRADVNDTLSLTYYPNTEDQGNNRGQLQSVTNGLNQSVTYGDYTALGKPGLITEPSGLQTTLTYDARGNVLSRSAGGLTTSYSYDAAGRLLTITLPGNRVQRVSYSGDRVSKITDALGNSVNLNYDAKGRVTGQSLHDAADTPTWSLGLSYDADGNLVKRTFADNAFEQYSYDGVRNLTGEMNPLGTLTTYGYDALRRLRTLTRAGQTNATLGYDAQDNVVSVQDAREHTTTSVFDDLGNERSVVSPDSGTTTSTYDAAGNLTSQTNAKNETVTISWDALNRPTQVSWPNALRETVLVWDENRAGALARVQEEEFERAFTYNALGQVTAEGFSKDGVSVSVGYGYDAATGDLVAMTYPSGNVIQFTRDANGQISAIRAGEVNLATEIARLPFGPIKSEKLRGGALPLVRTFDQRYQLGRIQAGALDVQYTRDAAGRVTGITGFAEPSLSEGAEAYSVNPANNQMTARGSINYTYDAAGNLASDGTRTFTWDALGRLKQVQQGEQVIATYGYDIQNRRFRKTVGGTTTYYLYNLNDQLIAEISGTGTVLREYVWLDGEPFLLAEYTGTNAGMYFYLNDHLGTPQQLLHGETGAVAWQAAYLPFGEAQVQVGTLANNLRFPGQYYDAETGLHYNWNRYYDPSSGRYNSIDKIGIIGGVNLYGYTRNNPVNLIDSSANVPILIIPAAIAIVEVGFSIYDIYDAYKTLTDPCADYIDRELSLAGIAIGMALPGGGYGTGLKFTKEMLSQSVVMFQSDRIRKLDRLVRAYGGDPQKWRKMKGWDEHGVEYHWYQNGNRKVALKRAGDPDPYF